MLTATCSAACMNTLAKHLYLDGSVSQMSLFTVRSVVVFALNGMLVALRSGRDEAVRVLCLRVDSPRMARLAVSRGIAGTTGVCLTHIAFQLIDLADAMAVVFAFEVVATVAIARLCLGSAERLSAHALVGGTTALLGVLLVTRPGALFGRESPSAAGALLAVGAGLSFGLFNFLSRVLGRASSHGAPASPAMLTSFLMLALALVSTADAFVPSTF